MISITKFSRGTTVSWAGWTDSTGLTRYGEPKPASRNKIYSRPKIYTPAYVGRYSSGCELHAMSKPVRGSSWPGSGSSPARGLKSSSSTGAGAGAGR
jgi:hypothetical protein